MAKEERGIRDFTFIPLQEVLAIPFWEKRSGTNEPRFLTEEELEALRAKASIVVVPSKG